MYEIFLADCHDVIPGDRYLSTPAYWRSCCLGLAKWYFKASWGAWPLFWNLSLASTLLHPFLLPSVRSVLSWKTSQSSTSFPFSTECWRTTLSVICSATKLLSFIFIESKFRPNNHVISHRDPAIKVTYFLPPSGSLVTQQSS